MKIRKANENDIGGLAKLLLEVQQVHSDVGPDLFTIGTRKYTDEELKTILKDDLKPIFIADVDGAVAGYVFCVISTPHNHTLQPIKNCISTTYARQEI